MAGGAAGGGYAQVCFLRFVNTNMTVSCINMSCYSYCTSSIAVSSTEFRSLLLHIQVDRYAEMQTPCKQDASLGCLVSVLAVHEAMIAFTQIFLEYSHFIGTLPTPGRIYSLVS